ncbi:uncharacterized protein LOC135450651 [Zonotrichia leucophrys gambelii]|uniref:uncharacterized protein LOC135450651 n=1 Tax=Zonotrichia leucophrys gambelii TaxID=257770 RepID=UPI00313FE2FF
MDFFDDSAVSPQQQVPAIVRSIHQRLVSHVALDARLQIDIVRLAEEHPDDVVLTLLRCAPTCDRFAVQAMKALLYLLRCDNEVMSMERKRGWDTILCAHTQHYAVGLLAREMRRRLVPLCSRIALHLLRQLSREDPYRNLPFLAFLVEVLECLDLSECGDSVLMVLARHLHSKCREQRRLALRGLVVVSKDPLLARRMCILSQWLVDVLADEDGEVVSMSLSVFTNVLQHKDILVSSTTAPKLAESLLLLFDHDNSHVQVLSIELFSKVVELVVDEGKKPLKTIVDKSLYALLINCHDENLDVAKASRETLLRVAKFLKRRRLVQLLKKQPPMNVEECQARAGCPWSPGPAGLRAGTAAPRAAAGPLPPALGSPWPAAAGRASGLCGQGRPGLGAGSAGPGAEPVPTLPSCRSLQLAEDSSRAAEHLCRALRYLESPQEPLREAAVRFMGMAGRCLRRQQQELRLIWTALQARRQRASPSCRDLENHAEFPQRAEELGTSSGSSQPVPQEEHQETPMRTLPPSSAGSPGTADAGQSSCGFSPLPAC